jgi:hypothetical protein
MEIELKINIATKVIIIIVNNFIVKGKVGDCLKGNNNQNRVAPPIMAPRVKMLTGAVLIIFSSLILIIGE